MTRKKGRVLEGLCLFVKRLIYSSRLGMYFLNVLLFTAIGCEYNCCHLCRFYGKTAVSILSESRKLLPMNEFVTQERQESHRAVNTFQLSNER